MGSKDWMRRSEEAWRLYEELAKELGRRPSLWTCTVEGVDYLITNTAQGLGCEPLDQGALKRRVAAERGARARAVAEFREMCEAAEAGGSGAHLPTCRELIARWYEPMAAMVAHNTDALTIAGSLRVEELASLTILHTLGRCLRKKAGVQYNSLSASLGAIVEATVAEELMRRNHAEEYKALSRSKYIDDDLVIAAAIEAGTMPARWSTYERGQLGGNLIEFLWETATAPDGNRTSPAFEAIDKRGEPDDEGNEPAWDEVHIVLSDAAMNVIERHLDAVPRLAPLYTPMEQDPLAAESGKPYYLLPVDKVTHASKGHADLAYPAAYIDGLNALNATRWGIVKSIWLAASNAIELGRDLYILDAGGNEMRTGKPAIIGRQPQPLSDGEMKLRAAIPRKKWERVARSKSIVLPGAERDKQIVYRSWRKRDRLFNFHIEDRELIRERAAALMGGRGFTLPHIPDYRGRFYPLAQDIHHHQSDLSRALMRFHWPGKVTPAAIRWIKIHAANMRGLDKELFAAREAWADQQMRDMFAAASDPMNTTAYWLQSEYPWQFLAACIELKRIIHDGEAKTDLPVQLDATSNGLQHLAALCRDADGAAMVNLCGDARQDAYGIVAERVKNEIDGRARMGSKAAIALLEAGIVNRSLFKRPVMTIPYNVTKGGMCGQVRKMLRECGFGGDPDAKECHELREAAVSLVVGDRRKDAGRKAHGVLKAMDDLMPSALGVRDWLTACARRIVNEAGKPEMKGGKVCRRRDKTVMGEGEPIIYKTPLGFEVRQVGDDYYKNSRVRPRTLSGHKLTLTEKRDPNAPINKDAQVNAFAPGFIHSLDASHVALVAAECRGRGMNIAAVHDSFWTTADRADELRDIVREQFVHLHNRPILDDLRQQLQDRYGLEPGFEPPPNPGNFDIFSVLTAGYFVS